MTLSQVSREKELTKKDLLSLGEFSPEYMASLLDLADSLKLDRRGGRFVSALSLMSLALIFEKPSTRTRASFEVGMYELGGHTVVLHAKDMQLSRGETLEDTARTLSQYCHAVAARVHSHDTLLAFSSAVGIPVINALSDKYHPCQTISDLQTIREVKGQLKGLKLAWIGDGNNVCNSLLIGSSLVGMDMAVACPKGYEPLPEALEIAIGNSNLTGVSITVDGDPLRAAAFADVIITDTFVSMGDEEHRTQRKEAFLPDYQVNQSLMQLAKPDAIFMHCLPAHRGEEVTSEVIDGPQSVVWNEAENRLHAQKAVLLALLGSKVARY